MKPKHIAELLRRIEAKTGQRHVAVRRTRGGHLCLTLSTGARVICASTPSDFRFTENVISHVRHALWKDAA
jgi:hypothetical protein